MKPARCLWLLAIPIVVLAAGCIVQDQLMTLTVNPDGSAGMLIFRSNIHSTEEGEKAASEISGYRESFDAQTQDEFLRMREAGARIESASWLRREVPMANVVRVAIPDAAVLEKVLTIKEADGSVPLKATFTISESRRRLSFQVTMDPADLPAADSRPGDAGQVQVERASGISDWRIAVTHGKVAATRGFTVADDRQSALLDVTEAISLVRAGNGNAELFVEWEVAK